MPEIGGDAKRFVNNNKINLTSAIINQMTDWIKNVNFFIKYQDKFNEMDIRKFLIAKSVKGK